MTILPEQKSQSALKAYPYYLPAQVHRYSLLIIEAPAQRQETRAQSSQIFSVQNLNFNRWNLLLSIGLNFLKYILCICQTKPVSMKSPHQDYQYENSSESCSPQEVKTNFAAGKLASYPRFIWKICLAMRCKIQGKKLTAGVQVEDNYRVYIWDDRDVNQRNGKSNRELLKNTFDTALNSLLGVIKCPPN